jgi:hypothetical protein
MCNPQGSTTTPLDYADQAAVAAAINQLKDKDHKRGVLQIMAEAGQPDIDEIHVHKLTPAVQRELYNFLKNSTGAAL